MIEHGIIFFKGLIVGFTLAMIVGPIGIFCIQQTLRRGFKAGICAGLGAASADGIYGTIAGFGLTFVSDFLIKYQLVLQAAGGSFLIYLGLKTLLHATPISSIYVEKTNLFALYTTTLFLTLANPLTILAFIALLTGVDIEVEQWNTPLVFSLFSSVFLGSTAWWLILTGSISAFRNKISLHSLNKLNKIAGAAIALFGILIVAKVVLSIL